MRYGLYPGCALQRNAAAYLQSTEAVAGPLGLDLREIDDWNCCGATEYHSIDLLAAYALIGRNLALAAEEGISDQLVAPCSACFLNLKKTDRYMADSPKLAGQVNECLEAGGLHYEPGSLRIRHLLEIVVEDVGLEKVADRVTKPLYGLRVAPYYGCMTIRPNLGHAFDDPEYPTTLDRLIDTTGAECVDYPLKANCCGGHMTQISEEVAAEMIRQLLESAHVYDVDMIAVLCPMCQLNLDAYQGDVNKRFGTKYHIPIVYFTQLLGMAFGIPLEDLGFGKEMVSVTPALDKILDEAPKKRKVRRPKGALPLPGPEEGQS